MQKTVENSEIFALESIIDMMESDEKEFYTLTYPREKFIKMVKSYIWQLKDLERAVGFQKGIKNA